MTPTDLELVLDIIMSEPSWPRPGAIRRKATAEKVRALAALPVPAPDPRIAEMQATIEAMSGDAADLTDLMGEAAAMRTVLTHLLGERGRIHDSGCGICDAGRALLTADHELPSYSERAALPVPAPDGTDCGAEAVAGGRATDPSPRTPRRAEGGQRPMTPADLDKINQRVNRGLGEGLLAAARWRDALIDVGVMLVLVGPPPALDAHLRAAVLTLLDLLEARGAIWVGLGKETRTDLEASIGVVRAALRGETP